MTVTITNPVDPDGCLADPCPRGTHDKQLPNDNTDFHGWQVVAALLVGKPAAADFGAVQAGAPATKSVGVRNAGPLSTAISGAEFTGPAAADYSLTDLTACQIAELGPGATCTVGLSFTPSTIGKRDASLVIHGPNTPDATIKLSGRLYVPPPKISAFTPTGARPGMPVDIMGTNFVSAYTQTTVRFAGAEPIVVAPTPDGTRISIFVPADARQGPVTVTADGGSVSSAKFVVRRAPADLVSTPETGLAGDTVVIQGNNLKGTTSVLFNGVKAGFRVASPNRIVAFVPTAATTGFITVVNPWGTATTPVAFTVDLPV